MPIQRFEPSSAVCWEVESGEYVRYSDHVKRIEQLEKQVEFEYNLKVQARTQLEEHIEELENQLNNK